MYTPECKLKETLNMIGASDEILPDLELSVTEERFRLGTAQKVRASDAWKHYFSSRKIGSKPFPVGGDEPTPIFQRPDRESGSIRSCVTSTSSSGCGMPVLSSDRSQYSCLYLSISGESARGMSPIDKAVDREHAQQLVIEEYQTGIAADEEKLKDFLEGCKACIDKFNLFRKCLSILLDDKLLECMLGAEYIIKDLWVVAVPRRMRMAITMEEAFVTHVQQVL